MNLGEWNYIILLPISSLLFMIGGTGFKWARRFVLPAVIAGMAILNGSNIWLSLGAGGLLVGAFCMPYGDGKDWWFRFMIGCLYALALLPLGFTTFQAIYPFIFLLTFYISNQKWGEKWLPWKAWEALNGLLIGWMASLLIT